MSSAVYPSLFFTVALLVATAYFLLGGLWGRFGFAVGAAGIAALAVVLRKRLIAAMLDHDLRIQAQDAQAAKGFRKVHNTALLVNLVQLVLLVWSLTKLSL